MEDDAVGLELAFERGVVFDDAVVDDGDPAVAAEVRMGVAVGGGPVRRPARVADADAAGGGLVAQQPGQVWTRPARLRRCRCWPVRVAMPALS